MNDAGLTGWRPSNFSMNLSSDPEFLKDLLPQF